MDKKLYAAVSKLINGIVEKESRGVSSSKNVTLDKGGSFMESLGVDSLLALEIVSKIEKKFGVQLQEEDFVHFDSMESIANFIEQKIKGKNKNNLSDKKRIKSKKKMSSSPKSPKVKNSHKIPKRKKLG